MKLLITALGLLMLSTTFASEKIYKWVDVNGQTHYTTKKPDDRYSEEMNIQVPKAKPALTTQNDIYNETTDNRIEKLRKIKGKRKQEIVKNKKRCQKAKSTLARFKQQARFSHTKEDGTKVYLEDPQREQIFKASNKAIKKYCK